jgi:2-alkyl-3-oxoalkanoate reductase
MMQVLVLGHMSFVGSGIAELLRLAGHEVTTFRRGPVGVCGTAVSGSVFSLTDNPHLNRHFDAVVNFILLKDDSLDSNVAFVNELATFVDARRIPHLVHLSSISSYSDDTALIVEDSPTEADPKKKGSYGSLKVATDLALMSRAKGRFGLTLIRPGFVLAPGLASPIVGMGARIPANGLLVLGSSQDTVPVVRRSDVHEAIVKTLAKGPPADVQVALLADRNSPSRDEYLRWCARELGVSAWALSVPRALWLSAGAAGRAMSFVLPKSLDPWRVARALTRTRRFDGRRTEASLGLDISVDWRSELQRAMAGQISNVVLPNPRSGVAPTAQGRVCILGFGGIVKQKHLPALAKLKLDTAIEAYDVVSGATWNGITVRPLEEARLTDSVLTIVASPGPAHIDATRLLPRDSSPIVIEKPLCMSEQELDQWLEFASSRPGSTFVLHNYRFKSNVQRLLAVLNQRRAGRLIHAHVTFQSPPVAFDIGWRRAERKARTLLLDYGLHFLDLATMFHREAWAPREVRWTKNSNDETDFIGGVLHSSAYDVSFALRQGFMPREAIVRFTFQNYIATLSFFPDVLSLTMSGDDFGTAFGRGGALLSGMASKISDKLRSRDADDSHRAVLSMAVADPTGLEGLSPRCLSGFYRGIFALADVVYGKRGES